MTDNNNITPNSPEGTMTPNNDQSITKSVNIELTPQNWLMLKHIEKGKSVRDSYYLAGYKGDDYNAPYKLYQRLKKKLELVYDADNVDSLRLKIAAKSILDMPIEDKPIKAETRLKAIETLSKLSDLRKVESKAISPFLVFKADNIAIETKLEPQNTIDAEASEIPSEE